jgi:hypothetical protein
MVCVGDNATNAFVTRMVNGVGSGRSVYLGMTRNRSFASGASPDPNAVDAGSFAWNDDVGSCGGAVAEYENWADGQPDNARNGEPFAALIGSTTTSIAASNSGGLGDGGKWNDVANGANGHCACQYSSSPAPSPVPSSAADTRRPSAGPSPAPTAAPSPTPSERPSQRPAP